MLTRQPNKTPGVSKPNRWLSADRLFWCSMLVVHAAALPAVWGSVALAGGSDGEVVALVRLLGLLASSAFFVLKLVDVSWLRLKPGWRSMATAILLIGLLHVGVLDRAVEGELAFSASHPGLVLFVAAAWQCEGLRRRLFWIVSRLTPVRVLRRRERADRPICGRLLEYAFQPLMLRFVPSFTDPRAPPRA